MYLTEGKQGLEENCKTDLSCESVSHVTTRTTPAKNGVWRGKGKEGMEYPLEISKSKLKFLFVSQQYTYNIHDVGFIYFFQGRALLMKIIFKELT